MPSAEVLNQSVLFVGAPNSGKTTLYNWFTGSRFKTVNYPGATVDYSIGQPLEIYGVDYSVIDTPGVYSLNPKTLEEEVTKKLLFEFKEQQSEAQRVIVVVDATHFTRQIILAEQLKDCGFKVVVALTMVDVLKNNGYMVNEKELSKIFGLPVIPIDGRLGGNIDRLAKVVQSSEQLVEGGAHGIWPADLYEQKFKQFDAIRDKVITTTQNKSLPKDFNSQKMYKWDRWLLHPIFGLLIFAAIMFVMFSSVFWLASPAIDFVDGLFGSFSEIILNSNPQNLVLQFIANGLVAGVGAFAVFVPQLAILFFGMGLLEDTGYLARASTLIDKPLAKLGMNGRAFVPILSSFACAIPGMMAARTIPSKRERWLTLFILPLMTCSARLPVYALLLSFLFAGESGFIAGLAMSGIYFASILLGALVAAVINRFIPKEAESFFIMELPSYRRPVFRKLLRQVYDKTIAFVQRAGPVIFVLSVLIWTGSTFPNYEIENETQRFNSSYAAQFGQVIEPAFKPMGADWRVGLGLLTSFAAREVFVSSLAVVFNITDESDEAVEKSLLEKMRTSTYTNSDGIEALVFTPASIAAIIVFFMIALQCMATVGVAKSEFGGWKFALIQLFSFNVFAYLLAIATYQILS